MNELGNFSRGFFLSAFTARLLASRRPRRLFKREFYLVRTGIKCLQGVPVMYVDKRQQSHLM